MEKNETSIAPSGIQRNKLKNAMILRLRAFGAFVWENQKSTLGYPPINCIFGGAYYGFYPSGIKYGASDIKKFERETMARMIDAGAQCAIISSIDTMEKFMGLNTRIIEVRRALPREKLIGLLKQWGKGKQQNSPLEQEILALKPEMRAVIFGIYVDHHTLNIIAEETGYAVRTVRNKHDHAITLLTDRLVSKGTYLEGTSREGRE